MRTSLDDKPPSDFAEYGAVDLNRKPVDALVILSSRHLHNLVSFRKGLRGAAGDRKSFELEHFRGCLSVGLNKMQNVVDHDLLRST